MPCLNTTNISGKQFAVILQFLPRLLLASFAAHFIAQYFRLFLYSFLKKYFASKYLLLRNLTVTILEQACDTIIFSFVGLYGIVHSISSIFIVSFAVKLLSIILVTPVLFFVLGVLKRLSKSTVA